MFWERFHTLCKDSNVSATQVVTALGISHGAPTKWRQGKIPTGETLLKISNYFGVSVDYLLGKTELKKGAAPTEQPLTPIKEEAINIILDLPDSAVEDWIRFLDAYRNKNDQ